MIACPEHPDQLKCCWHKVSEETLATNPSGPPPVKVITKKCCWCGTIQKDMPVYGPDPMHGTKVQVWVPTGKVEVIG